MADLVFTGACKQMTREALAARAAKCGHKVRSSFCSKTNLVVANVDLAVELGSRKVQKAVAKGVAIMSYEEFFQRFMAV